MSITGSNNPFSCNPVVFSAGNSIISLGTITRVGNVFTFSVGFVWKINGVTYQNTAPIDLTIPEAPEGYFRIDNALLNNTNTIELQQGLPSNTVAIRPTYPETNILLTSWNISSDTIGDNSIISTGTSFVKKSFSETQTLTATGTDVVIPFSFEGYGTIELFGALTSVSGFSFTDLIANPDNAEYPHEGKQIIIINRSGHDITLKNADFASLAVVFFAFDNGNIVIPNNGKLELKYTPDGLIDVFKSWATAAEIIGFTPENSTNKKNTIAGNESSTSFFGTINAWIDYIKQGFIALLPSKSTLVDADGIVIGDSADSNKTKIISFSNFKTLFKTINGNSIFGSGDLVVSGGGGANKRTVIFRSIYNGTLNSATNSWWTTLSGLTVDGAMSIVAALTPADNFASLNVQNPGYVVPFNCRLKSITVKGFSNTGQGEVDLALVSGASLGVGVNLVNTTILSNQAFHTQVYQGLSNGSGFSKIFDTGFTNYVIPKGYEIRTLMNNRNVAKNLLACVMIYEFEEEL